MYEPVAEPHQSESEGPDTSLIMLRRLQDLPSESKGLGQAPAFAGQESNLASSNLSSRRYGIALHRGIELLCRYSETPERCPIDILSAVRFQLVNAGVPARENGTVFPKIGYPGRSRDLNGSQKPNNTC